MGNASSQEDNWRTQEKGFQWTDKQRKKIIKRIKRSNLTSSERQLLLIGPSSAGKSSFINSILSLGNKRVTYTAPAGPSKESLTKKMLYYNGRGFLEKCRICDTAGVLGIVNSGFNAGDLLQLVKGHIKEGYKRDLTVGLTTIRQFRFGECKSISEHDDYYVKKPGSESKIHCIVFVFDASQIDETKDDYAEKVCTLLTEAQDIGVPCIAVLTKVDKISEEVREDVSNIFTCRKVEGAVRKIEELFGIPRMVIFPVVNYYHEQWVELKKNIVLLLALEKILHCVADASRQNIHSR